MGFMGRIARNHARLLAIGVISMLPLAACDTIADRGDGFARDYALARGALEQGRYDQANRQFAALVDSAGPYRPRVQLEYAHSLLRAGDMAAAAQVAEALAASETGPANGAALAVAGTARHEMALDALDRGDKGAGRQELERALAAMQRVLDDHPDLDPLGALAGRQASIAVRLKALPRRDG